METKVVTRTNLTCPVCSFAEELDIPLDYCLFFHVCTNCGVRIRPLSGDCCVFCSYGNYHCIPKQREALTNKESTKRNH